jgi:hypothetical protein
MKRIFLVAEKNAILKYKSYKTCKICILKIIKYQQKKSKNAEINGDRQPVHGL